MPNPLTEFDSPRKVITAEGKELQATTRWELGPGIAAAHVPKDPKPGEPQRLRLDISTDAVVEAAADQLTSTIVQASVEQIAAMFGQVAVFGGRWNVSYPQYADYTAAIGELVLVDTSGLGSGVQINVFLPLATAANKGCGISIVEISEDGNVDQVSIVVTPVAPQVILPLRPVFGGALVMPFVFNASVELRSTGDAWVARPGGGA